MRSLTGFQLNQTVLSWTYPLWVCLIKKPKSQGQFYPANRLHNAEVQGSTREETGSTPKTAGSGGPFAKASVPSSPPVLQPLPPCSLDVSLSPSLLLV